MIKKKIYFELFFFGLVLEIEFLMELKQLKDAT